MCANDERKKEEGKVFFWWVLDNRTECLNRAPLPVRGYTFGVVVVVVVFPRVTLSTEVVCCKLNLVVCGGW